MIRIGNVDIPSKYILAPMAGCTNLAFRLISREHGAKFCFFEMVDCNSITHGQGRRVRSILRSNEDDLPIAAQLLGREPDKMLEGAREICRLAKISFIDINAACPAKKVIKKKAGAYLLKDDAELYKIIKKLSLGLDIPVTVKIRAGYDDIDINAIARLARACEKNGAACIFIHGRTKSQGYAGEVDYNSIRAVKESVNIPVIGSGNIFSPELANRMMDRTGCDGVLVARGALGNPWIFEFTDAEPKYKKSHPVSIKDVIMKHLSYIELYNEPIRSGKLGFMKKTVLWYIKAALSAKKMRREVSLVNSTEKMLELIHKLGI